MDYLNPCTDVHAAVKRAKEEASKGLCTRYVNARVRMSHGEIEVTYSTSDWFCSDSSVYCANAGDRGEWL